VLGAGRRANISSLQETLNYWKQLPHILKYFRAEEDPNARRPHNFMNGFLEVCFSSSYTITSANPGARAVIEYLLSFRSYVHIRMNLYQTPQFSPVLRRAMHVYFFAPPSHKIMIPYD